MNYLNTILVYIYTVLTSQRFIYITHMEQTPRMYGVIIQHASHISVYHCSSLNTFNTSLLNCQKNTQYINLNFILYLVYNNNNVYNLLQENKTIKNNLEYRSRVNLHVNPWETLFSKHLILSLMRQLRRR